MEKFFLEPVELTDTELDAVAGGDSHGIAVASDGLVVVASADDVTLSFNGLTIEADSLTFGFARQSGLSAGD
jgi:hypothetical protein